MGKYLRIRNRGSCPRLYLSLLGVSTKNDMRDMSQGGWFGSGTKFAPVAALNLGMQILVTSWDDTGSYYVRYTTRSLDLPSGTVHEIVRVIGDQTGKSVEEPTGLTLHACKNWQVPIGADTKKAFRVFREYLRNAVDADPLGFVVDECDQLDWAPKGWTYVYVQATDELRAMLASPSRYFKYLPGARSTLIQRFSNGAIYRRSDPESTRIFSLGTLAYCAALSEMSSKYEYSIDIKVGPQGRMLLTEERTFSDLGLVYMEIKKMLAAWSDVEALAELLKAMIDGSASLEVNALGYLDNTPKLLVAKGAWVEAWKLVYGEKAVIDSNPYVDELARYAYGHVVIRIRAQSVRKYLKDCGIPEAADCVPGMVAGQEYRVVEDLEEAEEIRLRRAISIMRWEYPVSEGFEIRIFEPLTERMKSMFGFTQLGKKPPVIFIQRACLRSWRALLETLVVHECRHARTNLTDTDRGFVGAADRELAGFLRDKYGIPID